MAQANFMKGAQPLSAIVAEMLNEEDLGKRTALLDQTVMPMANMTETGGGTLREFIGETARMVGTTAKPPSYTSLKVKVLAWSTH